MRFVCRSLSVSVPVSGGRFEILRNVNIAARPGEFVCVVGPSGCGKTTLLRTIAGFLKPDTGWIEHHAEPRSALMVYQENSLFPWMTVLENACFGLEAQGVPVAERERRALPLLNRFSLKGRERAWPHQLSAGMKQRVAVIRSFLGTPDLLLMDEPFAALDCHMRLKLQQELLELWEQEHKTVLFVTHDVDEAILLGDRVVVMSASPGRVIAELPIPFERPRHAGLTLTSEFLQLKREIYRHLDVDQPEPAYAE
jgi:NitT/TauT family transport system ATP-binding protein